MIDDVLKDKHVWKIWVPDNDNSGNQYPIAHHHAWDKKVIDIVGGLTIYKGAKGKWLSQDGTLFSDISIPVEIICSQDDISKIIDITIGHYDQKAVAAYRVGDMPIMRYAPKPEEKDIATQVDEIKSTPATLYYF